MAAPAIFHAIQSSPVGLTISGSTWMFPTLETVHVFALAAVVGSIVMVDLRLLGWASKERPVSALSRELLPWTWGAFALAVISGALLFASRAGDYIALPYFLIKFGFMGLAGLNMVVFHFVTQRNLAVWDTGRPVVGARAAGALSLLFWGAVVLCARQVGFSL
jgi:uncharacterized membrane protein